MDTLHVAKLMDGTFNDVLVVGKPGIIHQSALARDGDGALHVVWSEVNDLNIMDLKTAIIRDGKVAGDIEMLAASPKGRNVLAKASADPAENVWVVWQGMRGRLGDVFCRVFNARQFANAESMLTALHATVTADKPEVLLLDVGLPGRSGLDIISEVHEHAPKCRIVILTVFEDEAKISQAISEGACGCLLKTARADEVAAAILEAHDGGKEEKRCQAWISQDWNSPINVVIVC